MASLTHNFIRGLAAVHLATATNIDYIANCNLFFQAEGLAVEAVESEPQIIRSLENILTRFRPCVVFDNLFFNSAYLNPLLRLAIDILLFGSRLERPSKAGNLLQGHNRACLPVIKPLAAPIISVFRNKTFSGQTF
jgi:hypothetical protein